MANILVSEFSFSSGSRTNPSFSLLEYLHPHLVPYTCLPSSVLRTFLSHLAPENVFPLVLEHGFLFLLQKMFFSSGFRPCLPPLTMENVFSPLVLEHVFLILLQKMFFLLWFENMSSHLAPENIFPPLGFKKCLPHLAPENVFFLLWF